MRQELIAALQRLARGHVDAAETIVNLVMPKVDDPRETVTVEVPDLVVWRDSTPKKKAK